MWKNMKKELWRLNLHVNLTGYQGTQRFGQNLALGMSVKKFLMRLALEVVDWVKQTALPSVGGPYPIPWWPDLLNSRQEGWLPGSETELILPDCWARTFFPLLLNSNWSISSFLALNLLAFGLELHLGPPASQAFRLRLELHHKLSWVSRLLPHPADHETCQVRLHNHKSILYNKYLCTYNPISSISLQKSPPQLTGVWQLRGRKKPLCP